jgi:MoxR-like ATPase
MDVVHDIEVLVRSRYPLLVVETSEEDRLDETLREVARRLGIPHFRWSATQGLVRSGSHAALHESTELPKALAQIESRSGPALCYLADLPRLLEGPDGPRLARKVRDLAAGFAKTGGAMVVSGPSVDLPPALAAVAARVRLAPPTRKELDRLVAAVLGDFLRRGPVRVEMPKADHDRLLDALRGLTRFEAERLVARAIVQDDALTGEDVPRLIDWKRQVLASGGLLDYVAPDPDGPALGGLAALGAWLDKRAAAFGEEAKRFGLPAPRGVLLLGVQGCGKSLAVKEVARRWRLPLLRLEASRLYDKWLGESEKHLERALGTAERLAPCVLWIDEVEKAFSGVGASEADAGLSQRLVGRLLTWLQERREPVFVAATCNRVEDLPPEMMRKGRFDEVFFVDLPSEDERREILALHLRLRGRDPASFDVAALAEACEGFSGAEVEQAVVAGLYTAFARKEDLTTEVLRAEMAATVPLSVTRREEVEALRAWARGRAVPAA